MHSLTTATRGHFRCQVPNPEGLYCGSSGPLAGAACHPFSALDQAAWQGPDPREGSGTREAQRCQVRSELPPGGPRGPSLPRSVSLLTRRPRFALRKKGACPPGGWGCCGGLHGYKTDASCQLLWAGGSRAPSRSSTRPTRGGTLPCQPSTGLAASARKGRGQLCLLPCVADRLVLTNSRPPVHRATFSFTLRATARPRHTPQLRGAGRGGLCPRGAHRGRPTCVCRDGGDCVLLRHGDHTSPVTPSSERDFQNSPGFKENKMLFNGGGGLNCTKVFLFNKNM